MSMKFWLRRWRKTALRRRQAKAPDRGLFPCEFCWAADWLLFFLPEPALVDLAVLRGGSEVGRTRLAGRGKAHLVTVCVYRVDAEHDFVAGRDRIHLLGRVRFFYFDRSFLAGGVLCRTGEAEGVTFENDRCVDRLILGQDVAVFHRRIEVPGPL